MRRVARFEAALALLAGPEASGGGFMEVATEALAVGLGCRWVGIVRRSEDGLKARTLVWLADGVVQQPVEYDLAGTPCADLYVSPNESRHVFIPDGIQEAYPEDRMLADFGVVSYRAESFVDSSQRPVGHVFVMDDRPLSDNVHARSFFRLLAQRAGAELNRADAEQELRRSRQRLADFAEAAADWFWESDASGRITYYSGRNCCNSGKGIIGLTRWGYAGVDPASDETWSKHLSDITERRPFRDFRYNLRDRDGRNFSFSVSGVPVFGEGGDFIGHRGTTRDMTSYWEVETRLQDTAERLRRFLRVARRLAASRLIEIEGLDAAVRELTETAASALHVERASLWLMLPDGKNMRCADRFVASSGEHDSGDLVPAASMAAAHGHAVLGIDDVATDPRADYLRDRHLAPRGITSLLDADVWREGRFVGSLAFAHVGPPRSWTDEEHVFAGFLAQYAAQLIEAGTRIEAERRLHESEAFYRTLIENVHGDVSVVDRGGMIRFHSRSSHQPHRPGAVDPVGRQIADLVHPDDQGLIEGLLSHGEPAILRTRDGAGGWVVSELTVCDLGSDPRVAGLVVTWRDLTERLANLEALRAAKEEAELANRLKSAFLANISHELRTPLNAVLGFSEIIRDQMLGPIGNASYVEYADDIHGSGRHLLGVINDILDLSKIEAGRQDLVETEVDVPRAVDVSLRLVGARAESKEIRLETSVPEGLPALRADERHVRQILINLLSNAVKFTPVGGRASVAVGTGRSGGFEITVSDTGIGMRPQDLSIALTPFGQVESSFTRRYDGTGLGLPLTKALAELHGGRLEIETAPGEGTTVRVVFPPERTVSARRSHPPAPDDGATADAVAAIARTATDA